MAERLIAERRIAENKIKANQNHHQQQFSSSTPQTSTTTTTTHKIKAKQNLKVSLNLKIPNWLTLDPKQLIRVRFGLLFEGTNLVSFELEGDSECLNCGLNLLL
jgi:hypothetical protein